MLRTKPVFKDAMIKGKRTPSLIAEIKLASPTRLFFEDEKDIVACAKEYQKAGVDAISVVTEKHFFKGDPAFVTHIKKVINTPILMKDFVIDPFQLFEAKRVGADAVLLIAKIVTKQRLAALVLQAFAIGVEPVVEIHDEKDLQKALATKAEIIAVNARDLTTFKVDVDRALLLLQKIPNTYVRLGFSGVSSSKDIMLYKQAGAKGILVGTSLLDAKNVANFIEELYER